jgi:hypothetical protein
VHSQAISVNTSESRQVGDTYFLVSEISAEHLGCRPSELKEGPQNCRLRFKIQKTSISAKVCHHGARKSSNRGLPLSLLSPLPRLPVLNIFSTVDSKL